MFDRMQSSYQDLRAITDNDLARFTDEFSARYLIGIFNPEFPMRCRENIIPKMPSDIFGIDSLTDRKIPSEEVV